MGITYLDEEEQTPDTVQTKKSGNITYIDNDSLVLDLPSEKGRIGGTIKGTLKSGGKVGLKVLDKVGQFIDRFGAGPTRAAFMAQLKAKQEGKIGPLQDWDAIEAFAKQFARGGQAPTGPEIAKQGGIPDYPSSARWGSPSDLFGSAANIGLDITNIIPMETGVKAVIRLGKKVIPPISKFLAGATDVATGTQKPTQAMSTVGETVSDVKSNAQKMFRADVQPDYQDMVNIAKKASIQADELPAAVKYGQESGVSMAERGWAESPLGEDLRIQFTRGKDRLQEGVRQEITNMGEPLAKAQAGDYLIDTYNKTMDTYFNKFDVTNKKIIEEVPGLKLSKRAITNLNKRLNGLELKAKKMAKSANSDIAGQGNMILKSLKNIDDSNFSYKQIYEELDDIGRIAFKSPKGATVGPDTNAYKALYKHVRNALNTTIKDDVVGGDLILKQLKENNKTISKMYRDKESLGNFLEKVVASEDAFKGVLRNTKNVKALKGIIKPEEMGVIKASYLKDLMKDSLEGDFFSMKMFGKRLKNNEDVVNALFEPEELATIRDFIKLEDRYGLKVLSQSGTGASLGFLQMLKDVPIKGVERALMKPVEMAAETRAKYGEMSPIAPMFFTPKAYVKGSKSRLKALQVGSVQAEQSRKDAALRKNALREKEEEMLIGLYGLGVNNWKKSKKTQVLKHLQKMNKTNDEKIKRLYQRTIDKIVNQNGGQ